MNILLRKLKSIVIFHLKVYTNKLSLNMVCYINAGILRQNMYRWIDHRNCLLRNLKKKLKL